MPACRLTAEIVIKRHNPVDFRARDVESLCNQGLSSFIDIAELLLNAVEDREQRTFVAQVRRDDLRGARRTPMRVCRHGPPRYT